MLDKDMSRIGEADLRTGMMGECDKRFRAFR